MIRPVTVLPVCAVVSLALSVLTCHHVAQTKMVVEGDVAVPPPFSSQTFRVSFETSDSVMRALQIVTTPYPYPLAQVCHPVQGGDVIRLQMARHAIFSIAAPQPSCDCDHVC